MATQKVLVTPGTAKKWTASGGDYALTLDNLATTAARQGVKGDLGASFSRVHTVEVLWKTNANAPAAGAAVDVYWAGSVHATAATQNPGGTTGADAAYAGINSDLALSLEQLQPIGSLKVSLTANTENRIYLDFVPRTRYGMVVVVNNTSQSSHADANASYVTIHPLPDDIQAAA